MVGLASELLDRHGKTGTEFLHERHLLPPPARIAQMSDLEDEGGPPPGVHRLDIEDDYFTRQSEFRTWLRDRGKASQIPITLCRSTKTLLIKYMDELDGKSSRKYFKKFVKVRGNVMYTGTYHLLCSGLESRKT